MLQRTFYHKLSVGAVCVLLLFILLICYLFWVKQALVGLIVAIIVVLMTERQLHTSYTLLYSRDAHNESEQAFLMIDKGRFSHTKRIALSDIVRCTPISVNFGLSHYVLIEYGHHHIVAVQPNDEQTFIDEIKKRQKAEEASFLTKHS